MKKESKKQQVSLEKALNELFLEGKYKSGNQLAKDLGLTPQSVNQYRNGEAVPRIETLLDMANYFGVSVDYLLGRTEIKSPSADVQTAVKITGLSEEAVNILDFWTRPQNGTMEFTWLKEFPKFLSYLIENENALNLIDSLKNYLDLNKGTGAVDIISMEIDPGTGECPVVATSYNDQDLFLASGEYAQPISFPVLEKLALLSLMQDIENAKKHLWSKIENSHGKQ